MVLGHNALYVTVGFVWLLFADDGAAGEEVTIRQDYRPFGYQLAAMLCFFILTDNVLGRIEGHEETLRFWLSSGRWELIIVSGVLSVVCQLLFWSGVVRPGRRGTRGEWQAARVRNSINVEHLAGHDGSDEFFYYTGMYFSNSGSGRW